MSAIGESLQAEVAKFGIRVLEILPGPIETDMLLASDKPAAAIEHERYRAQAEKLWEGRQNIRAMYTPTAEAARRIADAILDDGAPAARRLRRPQRRDARRLAQCGIRRSVDEAAARIVHAARVIPR